MPNLLVSLLPLVLLAGASPFLSDPPQSAEPGELPELRLPFSPYAAPSTRDEKAILNVEPDGRVVADGAVLLEAAGVESADAAALTKLDGWLAARAKEMETGPLAEGSPVLVPSEPLLVRADALAPFRAVQLVMERCGSADVRIVNVELAVVPSAETLQVGHQATEKRGDWLHAHLPTDLHPPPGEDVEPVERIEILLRVDDEGAKVTDDGEPWSPDSDAPFVYDETRALSYQIGPRKMVSVEDVGERLRRLHLTAPELRVSIDARAGVTHGEVVAVMNRVREAGFDSMTFLGAQR